MKARRGGWTKACGVLTASAMVACTGLSAGSTRDGAGAAVYKAPPGRVPRMPKVASSTPTGWRDAACTLPIEQVRRLRRGNFPGRSVDIILVPRPPNYRGTFPVDTTHSGPWPYLQNVPLVLYGPGFIRSHGGIAPDREITLADLAPTYAQLLDSPWPPNRTGRTLREALLPQSRRDRVPKLILTVVWDGGGDDVLHAWPEAWPNLKRLMAAGTNYVNATVGSSPSVTPAVHATIGTGTFPSEHGIQNIPQRIDRHLYHSAFPNGSPEFLKKTTIGDIYDRSTNNKAKVGMFAFKYFHEGMMGAGAHVRGGDWDLSIIASGRPGRLRTYVPAYSLPDYLQRVPGFARDLRAVDLQDGKLDSLWRHHVDLRDSDNQRHSPVWVGYQTRIVKTAIHREQFGSDPVGDLFYVNYKEIDDVGHLYNMLYPEERDVLHATDAELGELVRFLNQEVGRRNYVLAVTADHGQTPTGLATGGFPFDLKELQADVARHFDLTVPDLFMGHHSAGLWLDPTTLADNGISEEAISDYLVHYRLGDNVPGGSEIPEMFTDRRGELILQAAIPQDRLSEVERCVRRGVGSS